MLGRHFHRKYNYIFNNNSSKVLYTWSFKLKGMFHKVELWDSKLSGKKKLAVDDEVIVDYKTSCAIFNYSFKLDGYHFNVVQIEDGKFEIKINSFFFKDLREAEEQGTLNNNADKTNEENLDENDDDNNIDNKENENNDEEDEEDGEDNNFNGKGLID